MVFAAGLLEKEAKGEGKDGNELEVKKKTKIEMAMAGRYHQNEPTPQPSFSKKIRSNDIWMNFISPKVENFYTTNALLYLEPKYL